MASLDLSVQLGRLRLPNPVLVASGTFGYAREMAGLVALSRLGGILPKTITRQPRKENAPWRTVVGVVGDVYQYGLDSAKTMQVYVPYRQNGVSNVVLLVRGHQDPRPLTPFIRSTVAGR